MERQILGAAEIDQALSGLDGWRADNGHLKRRFEFANFAESLAFVNQVGELAEAQIITPTSHSAGDMPSLRSQPTTAAASQMLTSLSQHK